MTTPTIYNVTMLTIAGGVLLALAVAAYSLIFMIGRWRTPRRKRHATGLLLSLAAIPCLIGVLYVALHLVVYPAIAREQLASMDAYRAEKNATSSLVHVGDRVPQFELIDADGAEFSIADAKGKVVVLNFFATWCGPCLMELPHVEEIWNEYHDRDEFALLVIGREETMETVREFRKSKNFTFPIAPDPDRAAYDLFAKESIPRTIVISPQGRVVYSQLGFMPHDVGQLRAVLAKQLADIE